MVKSQLMPNLSNPPHSLLQAFADVEKHMFFENEWKDAAYSDARIPISEGRYLLPNDVYAKMLNAIKQAEHHKVLEIGTGCGYGTAILCELYKHVVSVESSSDLARIASNKLVFMNIDNVTIKVAELATGAPEEGPYDAIVVHGGFESAPKTLLSQLATGGALVGVKVINEALHKVVMYKEVNGQYDEIELFQSFAPKIL